MNQPDPSPPAPAAPPAPAPTPAPAAQTVAAPAPAKPPSPAGPTVFPPPSRSAAVSATDPAAEEPVWQGRPSWRQYAGHWFLWMIASGVALYLAYVVEWPPKWKVAFGAVGVVALIMLVQQALRIYSIRFRLTTQRIFFDRGILSLTTDQTELVRVDDVRIKRSLIDRMLGTGTVEITSSDTSDKQTRLTGIDDPSRVSEEIRRHTRIVRARQTLFVENV